MRARLWNSLADSEAEAGGRRDEDARLFARAEAESRQAAARPAAGLIEFDTPGVLEAHVLSLQALDEKAALLYTS